MATTNSAQLLPELMSKLLAMEPASLDAVHRFVLRLELAHLGEDLEDDYEALRKEGQLAPELIEQAIRARIEVNIRMRADAGGDRHEHDALGARSTKE